MSHEHETLEAAVERLIHQLAAEREARMQTLLLANYLTDELESAREQLVAARAKLRSLERKIPS